MSFIILVHRNIPMVPFLDIIKFILIFQIILYNIYFLKIKFFNPKHQNLNSKLNGLHFVEFIQKYFQYRIEKCPKGGHCSVLSSSKHKYSHYIHIQVAHTCICIKKLYDKIGEPFQGFFFQCFDVTKLLIICKIIQLNLVINYV